MKKLFRFIKGYEKESIIAPLFKCLEALFDLFIPLVVADIINVGIASGDQGYILRKCGLMVLLGLIGLLCSVTAQWFAAKAATGYATAMRHALFQKIQSMDFAHMDKEGSSTLITRMTSDINQVQSGLNLFLRLFMRSPFIVFGSMILAFSINFTAALIFAVTIPLLSVIVFGIMWITRPMYKKVQSNLDKVTGATKENLTGVRVVRAFHKEREEIANFEATNNGLTEMQMKVGRISALMNPLTYTVINLGIIAILYVGAQQVNSGILLQGEIYALVSYMSQILVELIKLANTIISVTKALACASRVQSILDLEPGMTFPTAPAKDHGEDAIVFSHVSLTYSGAGEESLHDISFHVKKGETLGIIGGTGSGKSSIVHLIPRFYDATSGEICLFGTAISAYPKEQLRSSIGMVTQRAQLFSGTIRSNLLWGNAAATDEELWEALRTAQGEEFVRGKPHGLDEPIEQGGRNLSGGQRQRLTIARALVRHPKILILDDAASALDYATDAALRKAIHRLEREMTVVIVSQRCSSLQHADRILVLDEGEQVGLGTHSQLLETCPVYKEIYDSQFKKAGEQ